MRPLWVSFFVFFGVLFGTYLVYQNWLKNDSNLQYVDNIAFSHATKILKLSAPSGKRLVPEGAVLGVNDIDHVEYTFSVDIEEGHILEVQASNVTFKNASESFYNIDGMLLFNYEIEMTNNNEAIVTVTVSLKMPANEVEHAMIQGSSVSFQLFFNQEPSI